MFTGNQIREVMNILGEYKIKLYHACQLKDFASYLKFGGVPSRQFLKDRELDFSKFQTGSSRLQERLFNKVFLNIQDVSEEFHARGRTVPNPYGPILIEINPMAFLRMSDLEVTLQSFETAVGSKDNSVCISSIEDFRKLFTVSEGKKIVKFTRLLRQEFLNNQITNPEMICTFSERLLSLEYFQKIIIDPIQFASGKDLRYFVELLAKRFHPSLNMRFHERKSQREEYQELCFGAYIGWRSLDAVIKNAESPDLKTWAEQANALNLNDQFERFAKYLVEGTFSVVANELAKEKAA